MPDCSVLRHGIKFHHGQLCIGAVYNIHLVSWVNYCNGCANYSTVNIVLIIIIIIIIIIVRYMMIIIVANNSTFATRDIIRSSECAYDYGRSSE